MKSVRLIAVWLLMLALPLQGFAALTSSTLCVDDQTGKAVHATHNSPQNHQAAVVQAHDHPADYPQHEDGQPAEPSNTHANCHHVFTGVTSAAVPGAPAPPHAVMQRVTLLVTLHIPELPLRPPQA